MADWVFAAVCGMVVLAALLLCVTYISIEFTRASNVLTLMSKLMVAENTLKTVVQLNGNSIEDPISFQCMSFKPTETNDFTMFGEEEGSFKEVFYCSCNPTTAVISPCVYFGDKFIYLTGNPDTPEGGLFLGDTNNPHAIPTIFDSFQITSTVREVETPVLYSNLLNAPNIVPKLRQICADNSIALPDGVCDSGDDSAVPKGKRIIRVDFNDKPIFEIPLWDDSLERWGKIHFKGMIVYRKY